MTTESRIKELEDRIARTEAVNLALLLVVQTLVRRSDDYTFIEVLELLDVPVPPTGAIYEPAEFFEKLAISLRKGRRHLVDLMSERLSPESSHGSDK